MTKPTKEKKNSAATKGQEKPSPCVLQVDERFITDADRQRFETADTDAKKAAIHDALTARAMSEPAVRAASVIQQYQGDSLNVNALVDELRQQVADVQAGSLSRPEAMLTAQAHTLDALFGDLARRACRNINGGYLDAAERYMRLALKSQAQAVRTIEALSELKNPRQVAYVRQANIANGHQQVINGHPSQAGDFPIRQNKQSAETTTHELRQDTGTSCIAGATHPAMGTLEALDRAAVGRG